MIKKKKIKKILSVFLCFILTLGMCLPISATELDPATIFADTYEYFIPEGQERISFSISETTEMKAYSYPQITEYVNYDDSIDCISDTIEISARVFRFSVPENEMYDISLYNGNSASASAYVLRYFETEAAYYKCSELNLYSSDINVSSGGTLYPGKYFVLVTDISDVEQITFCLERKHNLSSIADSAVDITEEGTFNSPLYIEYSYLADKYGEFYNYHVGAGGLYKVTLEPNARFSIEDVDYAYVYTDLNENPLMIGSNNLVLNNTNTQSTVYYLWCLVNSYSESDTEMSIKAKPLGDVKYISEYLDKAIPLSEEESSDYKYNAEDLSYFECITGNDTTQRYGIGRLYKIEEPGIYNLSFVNQNQSIEEPVSVDIYALYQSNLVLISQCEYTVNQDYNSLIIANEYVNNLITVTSDCPKLLFVYGAGDNEFKVQLENYESEKLSNHLNSTEIIDLNLGDDNPVLHENKSSFTYVIGAGWFNVNDQMIDESVYKKSNITVYKYTVEAMQTATISIDAIENGIVYIYNDPDCSSLHWNHYLFEEWEYEYDNQTNEDVTLYLAIRLAEPLLDEENKYIHVETNTVKTIAQLKDSAVEITDKGIYSENVTDDAYFYGNTGMLEKGVLFKVNLKPQQGYNISCQDSALLYTYTEENLGVTYTKMDADTSVLYNSSSEDLLYYIWVVSPDTSIQSFTVDVSDVKLITSTDAIQISADGTKYTFTSNEIQVLYYEPWYGEDGNVESYEIVNGYGTLFSVDVPAYTSYIAAIEYVGNESGANDEETQIFAGVSLIDSDSKMISETYIDCSEGITSDSLFLDNISGDTSKKFYIFAQSSSENQEAFQLSVSLLANDIPVTDVTLNHETLSLEVGENASLIATVMPEDATDNTVNWTSSDETVVTVDENGNVTAIKAGQAIITAEVNDGSEKKASCTITVNKKTEPEEIAVIGIKLNKTSLELTVGDTSKITATVAPSDATNKAYTWSVKDNTIATVSEDGVVTAVKAGTTVVTATTEDGGKTATCTIVVSNPEPVIEKPATVKNVKGITLGKNKVKLTWNKVDDAEGYLIYAQKNGKYGYCGMTTSKDTTTFTDIKALDDAFGFYWVFAYKKDANGKMITGGCEKYTFAKGICLAVTNFKASSVTGGVKLSWTKSAGADGYLIYGINSDGKYHYIGMTSGNTFTDKKASKTEYNFYWIFPYHKNADGKMIPGQICSKYIYGRAK